jgi:hypothetical protein
MSFKVANLVRSRIIGSAVLKAVLLNMADRASDDGTDVFSSKATIVAETEVSRASVFRAVDQLVSMGLIIPVGERPCKFGHTVMYNLALDAIALMPQWRGDTEASDASNPALDAPRSNCIPAENAPHQSQGETPTSLTVRPEPSLEPSEELSKEQSNEGEAEAEGDARFRERENFQGWTADRLVEAVIEAAEANPGHRNWRNPATKETVWGLLGQYSITPEELLQIIKGSRRGHANEHPNSVAAFVGDIESFVSLREVNARLAKEPWVRKGQA